MSSHPVRTYTRYSGLTETVSISLHQYISITESISLHQYWGYEANGTTPNGLRMLYLIENLTYILKF